MLVYEMVPEFAVDILSYSIIIKVFFCFSRLRIHIAHIIISLTTVMSKISRVKQ